MDRRLIVAALLLTSMLCASCGTALFKVKPVSDLPAIASTSPSADAGGATIRVGSLLSDEEAQELFEANLPVAGILPVRVELNVQNGAPLEIKRAKFRLTDNQNRQWKLLSTKQAVSRILKANQIFLYNPYSKKQFEQDMAAYSFDTKTPIDPSHSRTGFLFFETPDKQPVETTAKLILVIEKLPRPVSIPLN